MWCTTQNWSSYDAQVEQSSHDHFCRRNRLPSASKCFFLKQLSLDLARFRRLTQWTAVLFRALTHRSTYDNLINFFWSTAIVFLQHFYEPSTWAFFKRLQDSTRTNLFYGQMCTQYWMCASGRNAPGCLYLTVCNMTVLHYQFTHGINVLRRNVCFWTTFTDL